MLMRLMYRWLRKLPIAETPEPEMPGIIRCFCLKKLSNSESCVPSRYACFLGPLPIHALPYAPFPLLHLLDLQWLGPHQLYHDMMTWWYMHPISYHSCNHIALHHITLSLFTSVQHMTVFYYVVATATFWCSIKFGLLFLNRDAFNTNVWLNIFSWVL